VKILLATGIYPPQIGGPAQYAKNLAEAFRAQGHEVLVRTYELERKLPMGVRHLLFFLRSLWAMPGTDLVIALDTFSVAFPAVCAARLCGKKMMIRTGGDFLWEFYVERTGDLVLFKDFYATRMGKINFKERLIFKLTKWTLRGFDGIIFSTQWQRDIFTPAYGLDADKNYIVENFYGERLTSNIPNAMNFLSSSRLFKGKNHERLSEAFQIVNKKGVLAVSDTAPVPHDEFIEKMRYSYAVLVVSISDISPNVILEAIRLGKPFIMTRETGITEKLKDIALIVDPENVEDIAEKIEMLCDPKIYADYQSRVQNFTYTHSWEEIAKEFLIVNSQLK
jgi:glycosyltransferase involved in cell wall biosynthesis